MRNFDTVFTTPILLVYL